MKENHFYLPALAAIALILSAWATAWAEAYPEKSVNLIVAYEIGALTDMESRVMMSIAGEEQYLGQRINIVNKRQSLRGKTGWDWCKTDSCSDGYTMMGYKLPHFIARSIVLKNESDAGDWEPLANWSRDPAALIVPVNSPFQSLQDLIDHAKKHKGNLTINGGGLYVGHHIAVLQLEKAAGVSLTYIPEASGMAAMHSVMTGVIKSGFNDLSAALRNLNRVRILAIADTRRNPRAPDVPTFRELGVSVDDLSVCYRGVAFPRGVSSEALAVCERVFPIMLKDARLTNALNTVQSDAYIMDREGLTEFFGQIRERLRIVLKDEIRK